VVSSQREEKFEDFLGYVGQITLAKSRCETSEDERTGLDGIFFGVGLVVPQMEIDCLGYFHGAPFVVGVVGGKRHVCSIHHGGSDWQEVLFGSGRRSITGI
jgi:hypothetical protein